MKSASSFSFLRGNSEREYQISEVRNESQIKYYLDLCESKCLPPANYINLKREELSDEIKRVFGLRSKSQLDLIKTKVDKLQQLGVTINHFAPDILNTLTGGKDGTASTLIGSLIKMEGDLNAKLPPNEQQIDKLKDMFLVFDVPFEDYDILRKVDRSDVGEGMFSWLKAEEFEAECMVKLTKETAQKLINDFYYTAYYEWKKTRLSRSKADTIRRLEGYLIDKPSKTVNWYLGIDGNMVEAHDYSSPPSKANLKYQYCPCNFTPLDEFELQMFSNKAADKYISILKQENKKRFSSISKSSDGSETFEELRGTTEKDANKQRFNDLQEIMFRLESVAGYPDEELHNAAVSLFTDEDARTSEMLKEYSDKIRGFMFHLLDTSAITFEGLVELCSTSDIAIKILINR
jgi:hypothetical protein